ncbi:cytochrome P450 monooxygenase-like protein [Sporormia fimetaria CBS 119925]|uniref:Cytochrome P450 monooxygenase-like protein n=1 Tax=Sporormia fimetaria CBS 119925 TaxID=1340428 RepID=A0A6A6VGY4_9PLEO|nr:cytochrome P450 monooxygenase-like protein [Sporormia fimetaria CBS 119925]
MLPSLPIPNNLLTLLLLPISLSLVYFLKRSISPSPNDLHRIPPAHPLAPYTPLWISSIRWQSRENATLSAAHARLGPVIRLAPREISVNCVIGGIREVYGGGFEKGERGGKGYNWYGFFENFGGVPNMFSTPDNKTHSTRKRMLSNIYSKSVVLSHPALREQVSTILYTRFLPYLAATFSKAEKPGVLNIYELLSATTLDIVTGYVFGLASGTDMISDPKTLAHYLHLYTSRGAYTFWPQEYPGFTYALERWLGYRFVPKWVDDANAEIYEWVMGMCDSAAQVLRKGEWSLEDTPVVYQQLSQALDKEAKKKGDDAGDRRVGIASEFLDQVTAGFDTSGITLTYVVHELSKHPDLQSKLREELLGLTPPVRPSSAPSLPDPRAVDALPLLHAVIWETLRLHAAIPGPQPRFTPPSGCRLGPEKSYYIPGGVRVSASAGLLHMNDEVYDNPGEWRPERWLEDVSEEKKRNMESRWFWAFGSGGRMCIGSHLAVYQMKFIVAALYSNYTTAIIDDTGIEQVDGYTAPPSNEELLIQLQRVKTG